MALPLKKRKTTVPYDDGTTSYQSAATSAAASQSSPAENVIHSPSTQMYWNADTIDKRSGWREEGRKQYGVGSEYYKGLDRAGKEALFNKLGGGSSLQSFNQKSKFMDALSEKLKGTKLEGKISLLDSARDKMLDKAYAKAASNAYGLRGIQDKAILSQLGQAGPHREWREVFDNVTGKSLGYYQDDMKS